MCIAYQPRFSIIYGVVRENTKLKSHWDETPIAIPGSLILVGKILHQRLANCKDMKARVESSYSDTYGHGSGPHERLYAMTNMYMRATVAIPLLVTPAVLVAGSSLTTTAVVI